MLVVDLNNFARYPSIAVGHLTASLRTAGYPVKVVAPLMVGVGGVVREPRSTRFGLLATAVNHCIATSSWGVLRSLRDRIASIRLSDINRQTDRVLAAVHEELNRRQPAIVLVSTYLMYRALCVRIARLCADGGIPLLLGGPYFAQMATASDWARIDGVTAVAAGEVDDQLSEIVSAICSDRRLDEFQGLVYADPQGFVRGSIGPPLVDLDRLPVPDYSDYPWSLYPNRIVPVITGRGCGWGKCTFCSDITSTAGRTYRSRSVASVLAEIRKHYVEHGIRHFVFTDLKLNSDLEMWRSLHANMQLVAPGARWIGAVHVGPERDNGLSPADLRAAAASGCVRLTTGLETGSTQLSTLMRKGTRADDIGQFLRDSAQSGISNRCTMVIGYPGESPEDVNASTRFLEQHSSVIERVSINRLQVIAGTELHRLLTDRPERMPRIRLVDKSPESAIVSHFNPVVSSWRHRLAVLRLHAVAHQINSRDLMPGASGFEGVM